MMLIWVTSCAGKQDVIAVVGSEKITHEEFQKYARNKALLLGVDELTEEQRKELLDTLIQRDVVYLHARKTGIKAPEEKMKEQLDQLSFLDRLRKKKEVEKNLLFSHVQKTVTGKVSASPREIEEYYRKHKDEFRKPATYKVYLVKVSEADAAHVLKKVRKDPDKFDDMALKRVSKDLIEVNENAPPAPLEDFPEEMRTLISRLKEGEIGGPVTVERGTFLVKLVKKIPSKQELLADVSRTIDHLIIARKREEVFADWYKKISKDYSVEIIDIALAGTGEEGK